MRTQEEIKEKLVIIREFIRNQVCVNNDLVNALGWEEALEWVLED